MELNVFNYGISVAILGVMAVGVFVYGHFFRKRDDKHK